MRRSTFLLAGTAAMLAAPVAAQVSDFRLPPGPTPTPRVVGPLPDTPVPRASPTPAPTPTATTAAPAPSPAAPAATPTAGVPSPAATSQPRASGRGADNPPVPTASPSASAAPLPAPVIATPIPSATSSAAPQPAVAEPAAPPPEAPRGSWWPWIAVVFALAAAAIAGLFWLRRRVGPLGPVVVAEIERPRVPPAPALDPAPSPPAAPVSAAAPVQPPEPRADEAHPLHIAIELRKLSLTLMNATLGYRLTLMNAGTEALRDIGAPHAEMASLHGLMFMVRRVKLDYLAPARLDDSLLVVTETRSIRAASAELRQSFLRDGRVLVVLDIELVCVRLADGRPVRIPPRWRQALEQTRLEAAPSGA